MSCPPCILSAHQPYLPYNKSYISIRNKWGYPSRCHTKEIWYGGQPHQHNLSTHPTTNSTGAEENTNYPTIMDITTMTPEAISLTTTPTNPISSPTRKTNTPNISKSAGDSIKELNLQTIWFLSKPQPIPIPKHPLHSHLHHFP